jgi:hypothetical protein
VQGLANAPVVGPVIREHMKSLPKAPKSTAVITNNIHEILAQEEYCVQGLANAPVVGPVIREHMKSFPGLKAARVNSSYYK